MSKIVYSVVRGRHPWLCRWWMRTRPVRNAVQIDGQGLPPVRELYVPWWAWPLELLHRAIFGRAKLEDLT